MEPSVSGPETAGGAGADPDADLVRLARGGDEGAYERLVVGHQRRAFNVAYRILGDYDEAADATQEAFVQAYRALGGFRGEARFGNWLLAIVLNQCRNRLKHWKRRARAKHDSLSDPVGGEDSDLRRELSDPAPNPLERLESRQLEELVREEVRHLDEEQATVLVLRELQDIGYEEIAQVLGVPIGTVKSRLHRGRSALAERLRRRLGPAGGTEAAR
jgi:RNA polymerase sigma-70 factor (ECF subfamily)